MTLSPVAFALLLSVLGGVDEVAREAEVSRLVGQGEAAIPMLTEVLGIGRWRARQVAVDALERVGVPAIPVLMSTARHHPQMDGRRLAIRSLGRLLGRAGCDSLRRFGQTSDRGTAVTALGATPCRPSYIEPFLSDPDPDVRRRAVDSFAKANVAYSDSGDTESVIRLLYDPNRMVREAAATSLAQSNPDALVNALRTVRGRSRVALIRTIEGNWHDRFVDPMVALMRSASWSEQVAIVDVLGARERGRIALAEVDARRLHPYVKSRLERALEAGRGD